jgi:hypothetical protein
MGTVSFLLIAALYLFSVIIAWQTISEIEKLKEFYVSSGLNEKAKHYKKRSKYFCLLGLLALVAIVFEEFFILRREERENA